MDRIEQVAKSAEVLKRSCESLKGLLVGARRKGRNTLPLAEPV